MTSQSSGVGRGRGWLNLNKSAAVRPGPLSPVLNGPTADPQSPNLSSLSITSSNAGQQYAKLVSNINHLSTNDDGILLNQKLKLILETWSQECTTDEDVEDCINQIYQKSLEDEVFSMKLVLMVSSYSFRSVKICQQKIRSLFIGKMQDTFESAKDLQFKNPLVFRNAVRILSEFYNRTRLSDGRPIKFLATPLLCYFNMLLSTAQPADLELFTTLLYVNGNCIKTDYAQKLSELLNKVRQLLICNVELTQTCKLYLLLAIDIANNRFSLLPSDINKFYQDQLGDKIMAHFQGSLGALSIQTQQPSKTLDSYQSNVNVLQVTPPDSTSPINEQPVTSKCGGNNFAGGESGGGVNLSTAWEDKTSGATNNNNNNNREKTGRPILGAGARLQKSRKEDSNWRDHGKENSSLGGWSSGSGGKQQGSSWNGEKKPPSKGWEHDDRFDTDYN